jgi:hypothetical protein
VATLAFSTSGTATAEGNLPRTLTSGNVAVAAGDFIVAFAADGAGVADCGEISDTAGNTFTSVTQDGDIRLYYCLAAANASATDVFSVVCTGTGYSFPRLIVLVFTVSGYTMSITGSSYATDYGTAVDVADITSDQTDSLWVFGVQTSGPRTHSSQTIAGTAATVVAGFDGRLNSCYKILTSATTDDAQDTIDSASTWNAKLAAFDATPDAGGATNYIPAIMHFARMRND